MSDKNTDSEFLKRIAELELTATAQMRSVLITAHQDACKWLVASLLAINAGGLAVIFNSGLPRDPAFFWGCSAFVLGIFSALLSSYLSQSANREMIKPLGAVMAFWIATAQSGSLDEERWTELEAGIQEQSKSGWRIQVAGWISAIAFLVAISTIGLALPKTVSEHRAHIVDGR